jgi:hypothetical protein
MGCAHVLTCYGYVSVVSSRLEVWPLLLLIRLTSCVTLLVSWRVLRPGL